MIVSEKSHQKYQTISSFYSKKDLNSIKKGISSSEKMRNSGFSFYCIHEIIYMIMFTRSSERIFHLRGYTGYTYDHAHSFFVEGF